MFEYDHANATLMPTLVFNPTRERI
jgi:hypothetical protein